MLACLLAAMQWTAAQDDRAPVEPTSLPAPDQAVEPVKPNIEKLDDNRYRIGGITIDRKSREIRFPAEVNMTDGLLEFLIVQQKGKVHESLLATDVSPLHLNLAFTVLRYQPSPELYEKLDKDFTATGEFPQVPDDVKAAARVSIEIEWLDAGKARRVAANDWLQHTVTTAAMPPGPWVYGGSEIYEGKYSPEVTGDIAAIFLARSAILNFPGEGNRDDTIWSPYPKRVPPVGTKVTVIIAPYRNPNQP